MKFLTKLDMTLTIRLNHGTKDLLLITLFSQLIKTILHTNGLIDFN